MRQSLQVKLGTQLSITPQLQQAIRLLQLSALDLEQETLTMLERNPMLESDDFATAGHEAERGPNSAPDETHGTTASEPGAEPGEGSGDESFRDLEFATLGAAVSGDDDDDPMQRVAAVEEGLREHLAFQLAMRALPKRDHAIGQALIESLDDDGYLADSNEDIAAAIRPDYQASAAEIEAVRSLLRHFDPPGCGSRTLAESLLAQLDVLALAAAPDAAHELARRIIACHLDLLGRNDRTRLKRLLGCDDDRLNAATTLIRSLAPKPAAHYAGTAARYVIPDVYVYRRDQGWVAVLNGDHLPRLRINQHYVHLLSAQSRSDGGHLRGLLQEARWFLKSLKARHETILRVAQAIVVRQSAFFDRGPSALRPMVLRDIADELGLHESTISRVTSQKYMHTPRGVVEFKYFFPSQLTTTDGGEASSIAVQQLIAELIGAEDKPLSDQALADALAQRGFQIARRTVTKYREALQIPTSSERRRRA